MSRFPTSNKDIVDASNLITHVTVIGRLVSETNEDFMKLARLARDFRKAVLYATRIIAKGIDANTILRELRSMLNKA